MSKKLITAALALVALAAFALPATASAINDPSLNCSKGGATCAVGTKILGHNVGNMVMTDSSGNTVLNCTSALMTGTVLENTGKSLKATISTVDIWGTGTKAATHPEPECTGSFGNLSTTFVTPWCVRSNSTMVTDEFLITGDDCTAEPGSITFNLVSTTAGSCTYTKVKAVSGTYTTESTGDAVLTLGPARSEGNEFLKTAGSFICPAKAWLNLSFTLEENAGVTPTNTTNAVTDPLYIS
jgi:hypothetical protein